MAGSTDEDRCGVSPEFSRSTGSSCCWNTWCFEGDTGGSECCNSCCSCCRGGWIRWWGSEAGTGVAREKSEESNMSEPAASQRMSMPFCSVAAIGYEVVGRCTPCFTSEESKEKAKQNEPSQVKPDRAVLFLTTERLPRPDSPR